MLDARLRHLVIQEYQAARPGAGQQYEVWCEQVSESYNVPIQEVKRVIAWLADQWSKQVSREYKHHASTIADMLGASMENVLLVAWENATQAYREEIVYDQGSPVYEQDRDGNWVLDESGQKKIRTLRSPDFNSRVRGIDQFMKLHSAYAPEKKIMEISGHMQHTVTSRSREELLLDAERSQQRIRELAGAGRVLTIESSPGGGTPAAGRDRKSADGAAGDRGRLVLADGSHQNHGRTGEGQE